MNELNDAEILRRANEHNNAALLPALLGIAERNQGQVTKLDTPVPCELHLLAQQEQRCASPAYWRVSGFAECDECLAQCLETHPDSRDWLAEALTDLRERHLTIGARVRIQYGDETGNLGTIYNHALGREAAWHVRPDGWPIDVPGIAYKTEELDVLL